MAKKKVKRRSTELVKKMRSHIQELSCFFNQRVGALENMLDNFIEEDQGSKREDDR